MGYSPWGHKESDTTERLHFHFHFHCMLTLQMLAIRATQNTLHITALKTSLRGSTTVTTPILQITKLRLREK